MLFTFKEGDGSSASLGAESQEFSSAVLQFRSAGVNHVLPTAGTARFSSGLRASDYVTVTSVMEMDEASAALHAGPAATIANAEGLVGHARAMEARVGHRPGESVAG